MECKSNVFSTVQLVEPFEDALSYPVISLSPVSNDSLVFQTGYLYSPIFWKIRNKLTLSKINNVWLHGQYIQNGVGWGLIVLIFWSAEGMRWGRRALIWSHLGSGEKLKVYFLSFWD